MYELVVLNPRHLYHIASQQTRFRTAFEFLNNIIDGNLQSNVCAKERKTMQSRHTNTSCKCSTTISISCTTKVTSRKKRIKYHERYILRYPSCDLYGFFVVVGTLSIRNFDPNSTSPAHRQR